MRRLALSSTEQQRLEKLAYKAGRSPRSMMRFVLRDGFDFCERVVREGRASAADVKRRGTVPHAEVRRMAKSVIAAAIKPSNRSVDC